MAQQEQTAHVNFPFVRRPIRLGKRFGRSKKRAVKRSMRLQ
jgi:hypothetical protein